MDGEGIPNWRPGFVEFWPTILVRRRLEACEGPNGELIAIVEDMDRSREQLTSRYQGVDFLAGDAPAVRWLRSGIEESVAAYFLEAGMDYPIRWSIQSWPNINRSGDYHPPHNHAWCYLSGTYYAKLPADGSGAISFYDPRSLANMLDPGGDAPEYTLRPDPGTLLLWHSSLNHLVHPNASDDTRISISFNIVLEWANHYASDD